MKRLNGMIKWQMSQLKLNKNKRDTLGVAYFEVCGILHVFYLALVNAVFLYQAKAIKG